MAKLPHIIFLHGWGQSAQIWHQQTQHFSPLTRSYAINLPGHGGSPDIEVETWLTHVQHEIQHHIDTHKQPTILVGWSLGGQIALKLQQKLEGLSGLVLVSTTPRFRQHDDRQTSWEYGCNDEIWQGFQQAANEQNPKLMQRFFHMMLHGDKLSRKDLQTIAAQAINKSFPPTTQALQTGLHFLSEFDFRDDLKAINLPTLVVHGKQDVIVPIEAGQYLAQHIPQSQQHIFEDCGHAPFLTHHVAFNQTLESWWKNISA